MIERDIDELTKKLMRMLQGEDAAVAIGASLNVIMTCAQAMPDPRMRAGLIHVLTQIVNSLEQQASGVRQ